MSSLLTITATWTVASEIAFVADTPLEFDVVIVGAGIIGLSIAHRLLCTTNLSVALVDAARPCAGATGAGQGYVWLGHRTPDTMAWNLARRSKYLWEDLAQGLQAMGLDPLVTLGFKKTGSLLFGTSSEDALALEKTTEALCKGGVQAEFLNSAALKDVEPQLYVGAKGSAILTPNDCQIDAQLAASYILGEIQKYCPSGRFQEFFDEPAVNFLWASQIRGIQTNRREIYCNKNLVMAAGAWSGQLMQSIFNRLSLPHVLATKPRKGHLLVLEGLSKISLKHGLMEYAYKGLEESSVIAGIASTATVDAKGRVLLGSSRQFVGFDFNLQYDVMENILKKAAVYLPALANLHLSEALNDGSVRVGHRPYVPDGRPMIGEVAGLEGLLLATGHEGEGLSLALGTAEMIVNLILEEEEPVVDPSPFSPTGRLVPSRVNIS
ncbi:hypothetical protein GOP47_0013816 [Adiantum capillus-veneris]|uniref:FAD-dependent oxidoreductase domain-containing protein 1 n=1 Tax=Adiantum capillus-veneris TaxID=13818 RepID=A0A9D4UP87_ADICA|nr:hypothetical protein GOP47_0013816 [Adiantum capillus-veneris]